MHYPVSFSVAQLQLAALSQQPSPLSTKPILCLHGWLDNAASFIPLATKLPDLPILALEFPGHGHSSHRGADAHYYFFDWVQDLVALCRQQHWQQLTIVGHSMGGMVATALAAAFPELVERLVLIDSLSFITDVPSNTAKQLRDGISSRLKPVSRKPCYSSVAEAAAARQRQSDFGISEALLLAERGTIQTVAGWTWRADMRLRHSSVYRLSPAQAEALMRAVQCPVLAVIAEDGMITERASHAADCFANLRRVNVKGGHHCHMTQPEAVALAIHHFLQA